MRRHRGRSRDAGPPRQALPRRARRAQRRRLGVLRERSFGAVGPRHLGRRLPKVWRAAQSEPRGFRREAARRVRRVEAAARPRYKAQDRQASRRAVGRLAQRRRRRRRSRDGSGCGREEDAAHRRRARRVRPRRCGIRRRASDPAAARRRRRAHGAARQDHRRPRPPRRPRPRQTPLGRRRAGDARRLQRHLTQSATRDLDDDTGNNNLGPLLGRRHELRRRARPQRPRRRGRAPRAVRRLARGPGPPARTPAKNREVTWDTWPWGCSCAVMTGKRGELLRSK
mmetsp:Transcript_3011/g.11475  ORF Transcript_3011/g.11475 Transcript_3011/m.11475 type:complete len:283 (+) Transcript_3011:973-1821(+)